MTFGMSSERGSNSSWWRSWNSSPPGPLRTPGAVPFVLWMPCGCRARVPDHALPHSLVPLDFSGTAVGGQTADSTSQGVLCFPSSLQALCPGPKSPCPGIREATVSSDGPSDAMVGLGLSDPRAQGLLRAQGVTTVPHAVIKAQPLPGKRGQQLPACHRVPECPP